MEEPSRDLPGDRPGGDNGEVRAAVRFAVVITVAGIALLAVAALWASGCDRAAAVDTAACGRPQRMVLASVAPLVLCGGGLYALTRTYRVWRDRGTWWGWQGAGWFLLTVMLIILTTSGPPIIGVGSGS